MTKDNDGQIYRSDILKNKQKQKIKKQRNDQKTKNKTKQEKNAKPEAVKDIPFQFYLLFLLNFFFIFVKFS